MIFNPTAAGKGGGVNKMRVEARGAMAINDPIEYNGEYRNAGDTVPYTGGPVTNTGSIKEVEIIDDTIIIRV